jgi:cysteinyl-tRNA synthetase
VQAAAGGRRDDDRSPGSFERQLEGFRQALCEDLNLARATACMNEAASTVVRGACPSRDLASLLAMNSVLGVTDRNRRASRVEGPTQAPSDQAQALLSRRAEARSMKDWAESDRLRQELSKLGVVVKDGPAGQTWEIAAES